LLLEISSRALAAIDRFAGLTPHSSRRSCVLRRRQQRLL
jgi:hypothetical protein